MSSGSELYLLASPLLFSLGLYGFFIQPNLVRKLLSLNITAGGIFLSMIAFANQGEVPDPVPHALVLTGIVVSVSATAYGISLALRYYSVSGSDSLEEDSGDA